MMQTISTCTSYDRACATGALLCVVQEVLSGGWRNRMAREVLGPVGMPFVGTWNTTLALWGYHRYRPECQGLPQRRLQCLGARSAVQRVPALQPHDLCLKAALEAARIMPLLLK